MRFLDKDNLCGRLILGYQKSLPAQVILAQEWPLTVDIILILLGDGWGGYTSGLNCFLSFGVFPWL